MQEGNRAGNVNKVKSFYENLSSSDLRQKLENLDTKQQLRTVALNQLDVEDTKPGKTRSETSEIPPKPALPPRPSFTDNEKKCWSDSEKSSSPEVVHKPNRALSNVNKKSLESSSEQESGCEQNGYFDHGIYHV